MAGRRRDCRKLKIVFEPGLHKHLATLWHQNEGKCFYTGRTMKLHGYHAGDPDAVTVDRIKPEKGYVTGNVVLCCQIVNRMKYKMNYEQLLAMCQEILSHRKEL
ncbi:MAG: hypothetical protein ABFE07_28095 [Armatimonadia bacterium]